MSLGGRPDKLPVPDGNVMLAANHRTAQNIFLIRLRKTIRQRNLKVKAMQLQEYDTSTQIVSHVESTTRLTPPGSKNEVRELVLNLRTSRFDAQPGQSIGVLAPGEHGQDHHFRLYTLADIPERVDEDTVRIHICVRRCNYIDEYSGEEYPGVASNYLCNLAPGSAVTITGPYDAPFELPNESDSTLILIGAGTGIAPFRAFVKRIYQQRPDFPGRIWLFHGGRTGLDLLYMNEVRDDFSLYMQKDTFQAITALSSRPHWTDAIDWESATAEGRGEELWNVMLDPHTHVYVAGVKEILEQLDRVFIKLAGSPKQWSRRKAELIAGSRWTELVY